ncbi:MAG: hypothetical protein V3W18_03140 [candidate division Zixibacteria bacterium]
MVRAITISLSVILLFAVNAEAQTGACCDIDFNCIGDMNQSDCEALDGDWYESESCDDFLCPYPRQLDLAHTWNIWDCGVSNYGPLGEAIAQGNTYNWNGSGPANFAGTFVMGNSPTTMFSYYNPGVSDCHEYKAIGPLRTNSPYRPTARYSDGEILGGITIDYCGHGFSDPIDAGDIFVHVFTITNTGENTINGYYAGVFFNWDATSEDQVVFDRPNNLMYQGQDSDYLFGLCLINADEVNLRSMSAVNIDDYITPAPPFDAGWRQEDLHMIMNHDGDGVWDEFSDDMSSLMSTGPHTINQGESITVQIAVIGSGYGVDMITRAQYAATLEIDPCDSESGSPCTHYVVGDFNGSGGFNIADVIIAYANLRFQWSPELFCECPPGSGNYWHLRMDVNGSCAFNVADVISAYSKLKTGAPVFAPCPDCPPDGGSPRRGNEQPLIRTDLKAKAGISKDTGTRK